MPPLSDINICRSDTKSHLWSDDNHHTTKILITSVMNKLKYTDDDIMVQKYSLCTKRYPSLQLGTLDYRKNYKHKTTKVEPFEILNQHYKNCNIILTLKTK